MKMFCVFILMLLKSTAIPLSYYVYIDNLKFCLFLYFDFMCKTSCRFCVLVML